MTRKENAGREMARALAEWLHMMYNRSTALGVLDALIAALAESRKEFGDNKRVDDGKR